MRTIGIPGRDTVDGMVRQVTQRVVNPLMLQVAGTRWWYAAALHHVGRTSGRPYVTPVVADTVSDGFLVPLPYGTEVDWLRNLLAAGHATLDEHGVTYAITSPEVLEADAALAMLPSWRGSFWRLMRMRHFVHVLRAPVTAPVPRLRPDLRRGDPRVHDLVAELDEAIDAGDGPAIEDAGRRLRALDRNAGAGADT